MPAQPANGGKTILMVAGGALALGLVIGVFFVVSKENGVSGRPSEAVHRENANLRNGAAGDTPRSRLIVQTPTPEPQHQLHHDAEQREERQEQRERRRDQRKHREEVPREEEERHHSKVENHTEKEHNHTEERNATKKEHNATKKEHNHTKKEHNHTKKEHNHTKKEHGHKHKDCKGGPQAACECMLKCEVFGASTAECHSGDERNHSETRAKVDRLISKTMLSHRNMCDGMRCIKDCAQELECLDEKVTTDCSIVKQNYADNKMDSDPDCDLTCDS